jgi:hypothetical protein
MRDITCWVREIPGETFHLSWPASHEAAGTANEYDALTPLLSRRPCR